MENSRYVVQDVVHVGDVKFKTLKKYIGKCHKNWENDICNHNLKLGSHENSSSDEINMYKLNVTKAWMNTRKRFLQRYQINDRPDYTPEWLNFEDTENQLSETFEPKWKI